MSHNHCIRTSLNLTDKNITFSNEFCETLSYKGHSSLLYHATLSYKPDACPKCQALNSDFSIVKNGYLTSQVKWLSQCHMPTFIELKKQRFLCKCCSSSFLATSPEIDKHCFIANKVKQSIAIELKDTLSLKNLALRHFISPTTISRVLTTLGRAFKPNFNSLPPHLSLDEFKSVKHVVGKMSFIFADSNTHQIIDILPDRRLNVLRQYFLRYSLTARLSVKTIVVDMKAAYFRLACELFPNAKVIIDRFHLIQLISRSLNQTRIKVMTQFKTSKSEDQKNYRKLKRYWRLLLKDSNRLDFNTYRYECLFHKPLTETEIIDYLLSLNPILKETYTCYQDLLYYSKQNDFKGFKDCVLESKPLVSSYMMTSLKTLSSHLSRIQHTFDYPAYTNGPLEGNKGHQASGLRLS